MPHSVFLLTVLADTKIVLLPPHFLRYQCLLLSECLLGAPSACVLSVFKDRCVVVPSLLEQLHRKVSAVSTPFGVIFAKNFYVIDFYVFLFFFCCGFR